MPDEILTLGHHEFIQRVQEIEIAPLNATGLLLRLCASVEVHSTEPSRPRKAPRGHDPGHPHGSPGCHLAFSADSRDIPENGLAAAATRRRTSLKALRRGFGGFIRISLILGGADVVRRLGNRLGGCRVSGRQETPLKLG